MKTYIVNFCIDTMCFSVVGKYERFRGTRRLHLHDLRQKQHIVPTSKRYPFAGIQYVTITHRRTS
jgi:hypothetical protein